MVVSDKTSVQAATSLEAAEPAMAATGAVEEVATTRITGMAAGEADETRCHLFVSSAFSPLMLGFFGKI